MKPAKVAEKFVTPINAMELAVRLAESLNGMKRPQGSTAAQAFFSMEKDSGDAYMRAATAAMDYWRECINLMQRTN
jgi:hypothetical protein